MGLFDRLFGLFSESTQANERAGIPGSDGETEFDVFLTVGERVPDGYGSATGGDVVEAIWPQATSRRDPARGIHARSRACASTASTLSSRQSSV